MCFVGRKARGAKDANYKAIAMGRGELTVVCRRKWHRGEEDTWVEVSCVLELDPQQEGCTNVSPFLVYLHRPLYFETLNVTLLQLHILETR